MEEELMAKEQKPAICLLVDADMMCYRACASCEHETEWGDDIWTLHVDLNEAIDVFQDMMSMHIDKALEKYGFEGGTIKVIYCFSDRSGNIFRKKLLQTYKLNRSGKRKPVAYWALKKWVEQNCDTEEWKYLEADDVMGILATGKYKGRSIIISGDKDLVSIPTAVYNLINGEFHRVTPDSAERFHYYQTLVGDGADNYKGCPKVGDVKANRLLDTEGVSWSTVVHAFEHNGLTADDALTMARVSYILQAKDYQKGQIRLWKPPKK